MRERRGREEDGNQCVYVYRGVCMRLALNTHIYMYIYKCVCVCLLA